ASSLGKRGSIVFLYFLIFMSYTVPIGILFCCGYNIWILLPLISLPLLWRTLSLRIAKIDDLSTLTGIDREFASLYTVKGILLLAGILMQ
ncbi:MAG: hypothetical protein ACOCSE_03405, partial [Chitinivibrionales bacterium]